jgi:hypothetical protein
VTYAACQSARVNQIFGSVKIRSPRLFPNIRPNQDLDTFRVCGSAAFSVSGKTVVTVLPRSPHHATLLGKLPAYRRHKATGQAVVMLGGKDYYLGPWKSVASRNEYQRVTRSGWSATHATVDLSIVELLAAFWQHAKAYYVGHDGHLRRRSARPDQATLLAGRDQKLARKSGGDVETCTRTHDGKRSPKTTRFLQTKRPSAIGDSVTTPPVLVSERPPPMFAPIIMASPIDASPMTFPPPK